MSRQLIDTVAKDAFPPSPVGASTWLVPITTWSAMFRETELTGVEFDEFWEGSAQDGVAYFFRWLGAPRSTVLVVWEDHGPTHIECRKAWDVLVSGGEGERIVAEVIHLFRKAGFWGTRHHSFQ